MPSPLVSKSSIITPIYALSLPSTIGLSPLQKSRCVYSSDDSLSRRLFVAACAVDLTRKKKPRDFLCLKIALQLHRRTVIILNRVAVMHNTGILTARQVPDNLILNVFGQRRANAIAVNNLLLQLLRLKKYLVTLPVGKTNNLGLDARAISRPGRFYLARIKRRTVEIIANQSYEFSRLYR